MPALRLFGRRWMVASDDLPAPAALLVIFRVLWCGLLTGWLISIHGPRECVGAWQYNVAAGGLLAFFVLSLGLELAIAIIGLRGSIFETSKRRVLPDLMYADIVAFVGQIAFNGYCTVLLYHDPPECEVHPGELWRPKSVLLGLVWSTWAVLAGCILALALTYNLFPDYTAVQSWEKRWSLWASCCFCCLSSSERKRREALAERLGRIFALMFGHIDMTASDIITAFALAMTIQKIHRRAAGQKTTIEIHQEGHALPGEASSPRLSPSSSEPLVGATSISNSIGQNHQVEFALTKLSGRQLYKTEEPEKKSPVVCATTEESDAEVEHPHHESGHPKGEGGRRAGLTSSTQGKKRNGSSSSSSSSLLSGRSRPAEEHDVEAQQQQDNLQADAATLEEAAHFMTFAFAAYGYLLYIWGNPGTGVLDLCCGRNCGLAVDMLRPSRKTKLPDLRVAANLNREATLRAAGLSPSDLIFVRYESEVPNVLPYFIALDHATQSVVLAIRGSLSIDDVVRDLLIEPADLDTWATHGREWHQPIPEVEMAGPTTVASGHAGIVEAARATLLDLQVSEHLWQVLLAPHARCKCWRLVVTGHSLGAGCAFLIALYLRAFICPNLRCWSFSPPGGLASASLGDTARSWCTSVVCGREWIPRLTAQSFDRLRDDMVSAALRCRLPKLAFVAGVLRGRRWSVGELVWPNVRGEDCLAVQEQYLASLARRGDVAGHFYTHSASFTVPGRILHLRSIGAKKKRQRASSIWSWMKLRKKDSAHEYRAVWISSRDLEEEGIILSGRMMADHMPDHLLALLRKMATRLEHSHSTAAVDDRAGESVLPRSGDSSSHLD